LESEAVMAGDENNPGDPNQAGGGGGQGDPSGGGGGEGPSEEQSRKMFETLTMLAIVVEAAGGLERALRLGKLGQDDPEQERQLRETVPKSRGGENEHEDAESLWQTILDDALEDPDGRATFNRLRMEMDDIELRQARGELNGGDEDSTSGGGG
jgi:hypothetical protein